MRLSCFTTITDPYRRGDAWKPAILCYATLADEVVVIDGSRNEEMYNLPLNVKVITHEWPEEFNWNFIGQQFTRGYHACTGDWVLYCDIDMIYHQNDFDNLREIIEQNPNTPAICTHKWQFILPDRYNLKSRLVTLINKKLLGDRVKFDSGGDLCRPSIDGVMIEPDKAFDSRIPIYNYEKILKTYYEVFDDVGRMARAWNRYFNNNKLGRDNEEAFDLWCEMIKGRFRKEQKHISLNDHPEFIIPTIRSLQERNFGYNGFGMLEINDYVKGNVC